VTLSDYLPALPTAATAILRSPLALVVAGLALLLGFVLWKFMGDAPGALGLGIQFLVEMVQPRAHATVAPPPAPAIDPIVAGIAAIRRRDATFDDLRFLDEVRHVGATVCAAWTDKNLEPCRPLLADDCIGAQQAQMDRRRGEGWRLYPGSVTISVDRIVRATCDEHGDLIAVRVKAALLDGAGKVVRGRRIAEWVEDWSFTRSVRERPSSQPAPVAYELSPWRVARMDHVAVHVARAA
jgi:hypothetical protein